MASHRQGQHAQRDDHPDTDTRGTDTHGTDTRGTDTRGAREADNGKAGRGNAGHGNAGRGKAGHESGAASTTTDHDIIRRWADARGGRPAAVRGTPDGDDGGLLRIDFGEPEASLEEISWDQFFKTFEERKLAFLHQDEIDGAKSRFFKLVRR